MGAQEGTLAAFCDQEKAVTTASWAVLTAWSLQCDSESASFLSFPPSQKPKNLSRQENPFFLFRLLTVYSSITFNCLRCFFFFFCFS